MTEIKKIYINILVSPFCSQETSVLCLLICTWFSRRLLFRDVFTGGILGMFGPFSSLDRFPSVFASLQLQSASLDKVVDPGLQALAARTLQQRPVVPLPAAFDQPAMARGRSSCEMRVEKTHSCSTFNGLNLICQQKNDRGIF